MYEKQSWQREESVLMDYTWKERIRWNILATYRFENNFIGPSK